MTESHYSTPNLNQISAVTKHIKIYSDNPIHDAIDRIINSCISLDEDDEHAIAHAIGLKTSSELLFLLATDNLARLERQINTETYEQKSNIA